MNSLYRNGSLRLGSIKRLISVRRVRLYMPRLSLSGILRKPIRQSRVSRRYSYQWSPQMTLFLLPWATKGILSTRSVGSGQANVYFASQN